MPSATDMDIGELFNDFEARAAKRGMSLEEFIEQHLAHLQNTQPEKYDALAQVIAGSSLQAVHLLRQIEPRLTLLEATAQAENDIAVTEAVRVIRHNYAEMFDSLAKAALLSNENLHDA